MKAKIKPFTLFLCVILIVFLAIGPRFILGGLKRDNSIDFFSIKKPDWTGMITLWDIPYIETGTGSRYGWLNRRIREFENKYPGVFIDVRRMSSQRVKMYFAGNGNEAILPDIISMELYEEIVPKSMYEDLSVFFKDQELESLHILAKNRILDGERIIGIPWMMGGYFLFFNQHLMEQREVILPEGQIDYHILDEIVRKLTFEKQEGRKLTQYYGFCSYNTMYSKPLLSMIYQAGGKIQDDVAYRNLLSWAKEGKVVPGQLWQLSSYQAGKLFIGQQTVGVLLGNTRFLYQVRQRQQAGKGFDILVRNLPLEGKSGLFQEQVDAYGLLVQNNSDKKQLCVSFLKSLLKETAQSELKELGMFPVITKVENIYSDDAEMNMMENALGDYVFSPFDELWMDNRDAIQHLINNEWNSGVD